LSAEETRDEAAIEDAPDDGTGGESLDFSWLQEAQTARPPVEEEAPAEETPEEDAEPTLATQALDAPGLGDLAAVEPPPPTAWERPPPPPPPTVVEEPAVVEPAVVEPVVAEPAVARPADLLGRARDATRRRLEEAEQRRDFENVVADVERHVARGYDLIGLVGYSGSGKTHFLKALSLLLKKQGFEVADWEKLRKALVPGFTEAAVFDYPATGPGGEKWVFVDAGGELYARLRSNDWDLADESAALLHSLHHCRGLFLLLHLQPGHFRLAAGAHRWMDDEARQRDAEIQQAQEELEFFDKFLLFVRALEAEGGKVQELVARCAEQVSLDKALRRYRDAAPRLTIPVQVLFTQADTYGGRFEVAEAIPLSPRKSTAGVAPFVARHLPSLMGTLVHHCTRFRFDFVQAYEEKSVTRSDDGLPETLPEWAVDDELLSCGALAALEFLVRHLPAESAWGRCLQRCEIGTRRALRLDRLLHRRRWKGVELAL
jgi:energy-coupling factor transporter ATP-binding protein EcfA2